MPPFSKATTEELRALYTGSEAPISLLLATFTVLALRVTHASFDGDLLSGLIVGEVALHNTRGLDGSAWVTNADLREALETNVVPPTNVFSVATTTNIPRETVRRKVDALVEKGYLAKDEKGQLSVTPAGVLLARDLEGSFQLLPALLNTAAKIQELLYAKQLAMRRTPDPLPP